MRAGFGLVSLLLAMAIILYLLAGRGCAPGGRSYLQTVVDVKKEKEPLAQQWGTRDPQGRPFHESLTVAEWPESGALKGLEVEQVDPAGVAVTHFGLQVGDVITRIGPQDVGGFIITDLNSATDFLDDAFARSLPLQVRRNGQTITLPNATGPGSGAGGGAGGGAGTVPTPGNLPLPQSGQ